MEGFPMMRDKLRNHIWLTARFPKRKQQIRLHKPRHSDTEEQNKTCRGTGVQRYRRWALTPDQATHTTQQLLLAKLHWPRFRVAKVAMALKLAPKLRRT